MNLKGFIHYKNLIHTYIHAYNVTHVIRYMFTKVML